MRLTPLLLAAAVISCSSSEDGTGTTGESGSAPIGWTPPKVDVDLQMLANSGSERLVQGFFATGRNDGNSCADETVDGCMVETCTKTDGANKGTVLDVGEVTVTSASFGTVPLPALDASGFTRLVQTGDVPGGEEVRVSSKGTATVAAFDLKVKSPATFVSTSFGGCVKQASGSCAVTATAPVARWTGGSKYMSIVLSPTLDTPTTVSLRCTFDGAKGSGGVPAAALAKLPRTTDYRVSFRGHDESATNADGSKPRIGLGSARWGTNGQAASTISLPK